MNKIPVNKQIFFIILIAALCLGAAALGVELKNEERLKAQQEAEGSEEASKEGLVTEKPYELNFSTAAVSFKDKSGQNRKSCLLFKDDNCYVLLPAFCDLDSASFSCSPFTEQITLDGVRVKPGKKGIIKELSLQASHPILELKKGKSVLSGRLYIMKSENLPTLYVTTNSGSMDEVNTDKTVAEKGRLVVINADGYPESDSNISIHARGKSTFKLSEKKSYRINFEKKIELMGLKKDKAFILQGNSFDPTKLRNALSYELAARLGMESVPQYKFTDVYFDDEYAGNYLVLSTVSAAAGKFEQGDYQFSIDNETDDVPRFYTEQKVRMNILYPEEIEEAEIEQIRDDMSEKIRSISECSASNDISLLDERIDMDSFAKSFLLEELTDEVDVNSASTFFYIKDGILCAGPPWDFDRAFGNETLRGRNYQINGFSDGLSEMFYPNWSFLEMSSEILGQKDELKQFMSEFIDENYEYTKASVLMDRTLYGPVDDRFVDKGFLEDNLEYLRAFMENRYALVYDFVNNPQDYCRVFVQNKRFRRVMWIRINTAPTAQVMEDLYTIYDCEELTDKNGNVFDESYVVSEDIEIYSQDME